MSSSAKFTCGIILLTVPAIAYGGYFLLTILTGTDTSQLTDFQQAMFRAGHAHAGVLVILALVAQLLTDHAGLNNNTERLVRNGFPFAAIFVSGGFFFSAMGKGVTQPNGYIWILYFGVALLLLSSIILGVGLLRSKNQKII